MAESALRAGCRFFFGYPITPQTELAAYMSKRMEKVGGTFLQAESEIAAINMVYGAAAAGARVMTSSSSPGISLKGEGISYMAGADLPGVIINVQRGGPGLGVLWIHHPALLVAGQGLQHLHRPGVALHHRDGAADELLDGLELVLLVDVAEGDGGAAPPGPGRVRPMRWT